MSAYEISETLPRLIDKLKHEVLDNLNKKEVREKLNNEIQKNKLFNMIWDIEDVITYIWEIKKSKESVDATTASFLSEIERAKGRLQRIFNEINDGTFFISEDKYELVSTFVETLDTLKDDRTAYYEYLYGKDFVHRYSSAYVREDQFALSRQYRYRFDIFKDIKKSLIALLGDKNKLLKVLFATGGASIYTVNDYKVKEIVAKETYPKVNMYSIYNEAFGEYEGMDRSDYEGVAVGYIDKVICTSSAFDVVDMTYFDDCPYDLIDDDGKKKTETGIKYLERCLRYVKDNGYILITIPRSCINKKFLSMLASNGDIAGIYCINNDYIDHTMIVFQRKFFTSDMTGSKYRSYRRIFHTEGTYSSNRRDEAIIPEGIEDFHNSEAKKIAIFRGDKPDTEMFINILRKSTAYNPVEEEFTVQPAPLLPLTKGQVGQILVSGNLNGIIDEGNGCKHIIKGTVRSDVIELPAEYTSMRNVEGYKNSNYYTRKQVTYNSKNVHVTVLTADGEIKIL